MPQRAGDGGIPVHAGPPSTPELAAMSRHVGTVTAKSGWRMSAINLGGTAGTRLSRPMREEGVFICVNI
jgi:hypothetical protein